ncbi:MAG: ankyrin repeat domain-containing protein, partial [Planctomycetaceae bacterium]|nr:ankyrin repeat domain-containing protein [Planctomycetaceae bacterium]
KEAVKWYRKAAEQGNAMAQLILGGYYAEGIGVDKNLEEAVKWFRKSAEHNNPDGQWFLGCCYADGKGLTKDEEEAIKWWQKAAKQGHELASKKLEDYKKLADNPNDSNKNRIIKAVQKGDLKTVKKLVEIEPSILKTQNTDPIIDINKYPVFRGVLQNNVDGRNLLHFAASVPESFDVLKYLIEQKADVNAIDGRGLTPLFCAALVQNEKAVLYLLEHGADRPQFKHYQLPERELNLAKFYGIMDGGRKISERKVEHDDHTEVIETFDLSTMDRGYNSLRASRKQLIDKIAAYINSVSH